MSTIGIILIVIAVLAVLAIAYFAAFSPKRRAEKRLRGEREQAATRHRELASEREHHASIAEQKAEEAKVQAQRAEHDARIARDEAGLHEGRADLHDQGLADHELESGEASPNGRHTENVDRAGYDERTEGERPASMSDRGEGRFTRDGETEHTTVDRDGTPDPETTPREGERRDAPAERW